MPALANPTKLSVIRARQGLTQTTLAQKVNKTQGDISLYETGGMVPMNDTLKKIAETLGYRGDPKSLLDLWDVNEDLDALLEKR